MLRAPRSARLRTGGQLRILDVSSWGALAQTSERLLPGRYLDVHVVSVQGRVLVRSRIARAYVARVEANAIEYHAPARFDDLIEVFIRVSRIGRTSVTYECAAYRADDDVLMVTAQQTLVLVDLQERRAFRIPETYREQVAAFEGEDLER